MTLVVFGTLSCRAPQSVLLSFAIDGNAIASPFEAELRDARLPVSLHGRATVPAGTHEIELQVEADDAFEVQERLLTAMLYRERS